MNPGGALARSCRKCLPWSCTIPKHAPHLRPFPSLSLKQQRWIFQRHRLLNQHHPATRLPCHSSTPPNPSHQCAFSTNPARYNSPQLHPLDDTTYHDLAESYLGTLQESLEAFADASTRPQDLEVEYSQGTLEIKTPNGTYVLNKQPPNKQIWLSSPVSGPKRFDWVQEEAAQSGRWTYLRDGTVLTELLKEEIGVELGEESGEG